MPTNVLLLRAPSEDANGADKYEEAFRTRGYRAVNVPVLETVHTNVDTLKQIVRGGGSGYAGVIITSGRAVEAWRLVVQQLMEEGEGEGTGAQLSHHSKCDTVFNIEFIQRG